MPNPLQAVRLQLYKEAYERELTRRQEGMDRQSRAITIFTLLGGIIAFYSSNLPQSSVSIWFILFYSFAGIGLILASIGFSMLVWTLWKGTTYTFFNTPKAIDDPYVKLIADGTITDANAQHYAEQLDGDLLEQYRDFATLNQLGNNLRDGRYNKILRWAISAVVALAAAAPFHLAIKQGEDRKTERVTITDPIRIMADSNPRSGQESTAAPQPKPAAPAQPSAPPVAILPAAAAPIARVGLPDGIRLKAGVETPIAKVGLPAGIRLNEAFGRKEIQQNQQPTKASPPPDKPKPSPPSN